MADQNPKELFFEMPNIWLLPKTNAQREKEKKTEHVGFGRVIYLAICVSSVQDIEASRHALDHWTQYEFRAVHPAADGQTAQPGVLGQTRRRHAHTAGLLTDRSGLNNKILKCYFQCRSSDSIRKGIPLPLKADTITCPGEQCFHSFDSL